MMTPKAGECSGAAMAARYFALRLRSDDMTIARAVACRRSAEQSAGQCPGCTARCGRHRGRAGGWIPFDRYMQLVLYAPGLGYYAAGATKFGTAGAGGVSSPRRKSRRCLHARWQTRSRKSSSMDRDVSSNSVPVPAASHAICSSALRACGCECEQYSIVEVSSELQQRQRLRLDGEPVEWLTGSAAGLRRRDAGQ